MTDDKYIGSLDSVITQYSADWFGIVETHGLNPTLGPAWTAMTARSHDVYDDASAYVHLVDGHLVCVIAFRLVPARKFGFPYRRVELLGNLVSYHQDIVSTYDIIEELSSFLRLLGRRWTVLGLSAVAKDSKLSSELSRLPQNLVSSLTRSTSDNSPYLLVTQTWSEYLQTRPKKFRYKLRKRGEQIVKDDNIGLRWLEAATDISDLLAAIEQIEANSWKVEEGHAIHTRQHELRYYTELLPYLAGQGWLIANVLDFQDRPIAYALCCRCGDWVGHMKTSFDRGFDKYSPGATVVDLVIQRAFDEGAKEFDFLGDAQPHKLAWTSATRPHENLELFSSSAMGRFFGFLKRLNRAGN